MCAEGIVCIATFAVAMIFTLPGALRQRRLAVWLVWRVSPQDFQCAPAFRGGIRIQCGSAVATCTAKSSGEAIENHKKKSHTVEIKCQDAKAENQLRWQRD